MSRALLIIFALPFLLIKWTLQLPIVIFATIWYLVEEGEAALGELFEKD